MKDLIQHRFRLNRYEKLMKGNGQIFNSLCAGISKSIRLSFSTEDSHLKTIWDTAANIIGPAFFFFNLWVLQAAKAKGIKRLYYISRDGQIHLEIAKAICKKWKFDIECKYLYGSTHSWSFPLMTEKEIEDRIKLIISNKDTTFKDLLYKLNFENDFPEKILKLYGLKHMDLEGRISDGRLVDLKNYLSSADFINLIIENVQKKLSDTISYLRQAEISQAENHGFVPFLWSGRSLKRLSKILDKSSEGFNCKIYGFYFCFLDKIEFDHSELFSFLGDYEAHFYAINSLKINFMEVFSCADHTTVRYFEKNNGFYQPVLKGDAINENYSWGIQKQHDGILRFTEEYVKLSELESTDFEAVRKYFIDSFKLFLEQPTKNEASAYGKFLFSSNSEDIFLKELSPLLNFGKIFSFLFKSKIYKKRGVIWIQGSFARSMKRFSTFFIFILNIRFKLGKIKRRLFANR